MTIGERWRIIVCFAVLGVVALCVVGRLGDLQVLRAAGSEPGGPPLMVRELPAPRGTIVDRHGEPLAFDRPVYEVRVQVCDLPGLPRPTAAEDPAAIAAAEARLVADLLWALCRDQVRFGEPVDRDALRARLDARVAAAVERIKGKREVFDILVDGTIDDAEVIAALRSLDFRVVSRTKGAARPRYRLYFDFLSRFERVYAEPEHAAGVVGTVRAAPLTRATDGGEAVVDDRIPVSGLERLAVLEPRAWGREERIVDALRAALWTNRRTEPEDGVVLHSTLDRELQVWADIEIGRAAEDVTAAYESPPEWGALVLVDVPTGDVLAMGSYAAEKDGSRSRYGAFAPTRRLFEPGSVVKPLHVAMGLERGTLSWGEIVDCTPGYHAGEDEAKNHGWKLPGRQIRDSHPNDHHTPAEVLIRSSNIGAVRLGLRLGPAGIEDYLQHYRLGTSTGLPLPGEAAGKRPSEPIPALNRAEQYVYSGPSVLFGYQLHVTAVQVARAFLTFLSGRERELRLVSGIEVGGTLHGAPPEPQRERFLSATTVETVKTALVGVVEDEHGTARRVGTWLDSLRADGRVDIEMAGKTGTSEYEGRVARWDGSQFSGSIRTASFVGFTPVREPRYLVVCVLQKAGVGSFYGGTYAAPAASRLLVRALDRALVEPAATAGRSGPEVAVGGTEPGGSVVSKRR